MIPRTLIQIHYHDHPGGVTRVMGEYARTFTALGNGAVRNVIICAHAETGNSDLPPGIVFNYSRMGYRRFSDLATFNVTRFAMFHRLRELVTDSDNLYPIAVIGHNMTLGKNLALTSAFAGCARTLGSDRIRFFSMVHDLAEEGRIDMLGNIDTVEKMGVRIRELMYFRHPHLTYVTLNLRAYRALSSAGLPVQQMINPVAAASTITLSTAGKEAVDAGLEQLASEDGTPFDPAKPTVFYPSRIVPRKNIAEAILVACIINKYNLVTGAPGQSRADRATYKQLLLFCRKHCLPVIFGFDRLAPFVKTPLLPTLYAYSHCCISTSLLEGFGFGLYEPWLYNRVVFGRIPAEFTDHPGFNTCTFYSSLCVPVNDGSCSDFGRLDLGKQVSLLQRLLAHPQYISKIHAFDFKMVVRTLVPGLDEKQVSKNAQYVARTFGPKAFTAAFKRVFMAASTHKPGPLQISKIQNSL